MAEVLAIQYEFSEQELLEQKRYDLKTQFAELVDGTMRTEFELYFNGHDLIGEDGRSLDKTTQDALDDAKDIVREKPNLWFEIRRRSIEREEFEELIKMARGEGPNTIVVISDFPPELMNTKKDVGGYNVTRKQTMKRVITRQLDGNMRMVSRSLDGSNREALEAICSHLNFEPAEGELLGQRIRKDLSPEQQETLDSELTGVYDTSLTEQFGGKWHAGRRPADYRNTYDFVCLQEDLLEECLRLDKLGWLNEEVMYDMAATMNKRFEAEKQKLLNNPTAQSFVRPPTFNLGMLHQEMNLAGHEARQAGKSFSACGVTLGAEGMSENEFEQAGYGNKTGEKDCEFVSKKCPVCGEKNAKTKSKDGKYYHIGKKCAS
jgi:hypothetical protein